MASHLQPTGAAHILGLPTQIDFVADDIQLIFYSTTWDDTDEFISDLSGGAIVARSGNLSGKTVTAGVLDANNITLTSVSGSAFSRVVLVKSTGVDASSPIVGVYEVTTFTPDGGNVNVVFNVAGLLSIA